MALTWILIGDLLEQSSVDLVFMSFWAKAMENLKY